MTESERIEYKASFSSDIYKEFVAFANSGGGTVYIGVEDNGTVCGVADTDEVYTRLTNGVRDAIQPDITMFVRYTLQENNVICAEVSDGSYKPYYLKSKGLKPSGVYVRQGASSVPASYDQIRRMIRDSDGGVYEELRTLNSELSFDYASDFFARSGVEFSLDKCAALGFINIKDGAYTNLAELFSDQCRHTIKLAVFGDRENTVFRDKREFGGSVLKQLEGACNYLSLCNRTSALIEGFKRIEKSDYPEEAIREGLFNAVVHRDYSYSGSIIVNINDCCMEFISLGGLMPGLTEADVKNGISQPRNRKLAEVFYRLKLIESYGTGIRRIFSLYKDCASKPELVITPNSFRLVLPNMNSSACIKTEKNRVSEPAAAAFRVSERFRTVMDYISVHGEVDEPGLRKLLGVKRTRAYVIAREMEKLGLIEISGRGSEKRYRLKS